MGQQAGGHDNLGFTSVDEKLFAHKAKDCDEKRGCTCCDRIRDFEYNPQAQQTQQQEMKKLVQDQENMRSSLPR
ncbi:V-type proton ATPase subunit C [Acorus calamus]|uniref:V-type proton ATPase subunit C n=1 Tax=Acorus calamus TaxID=4465 RepID=A0AAV9ENB4_ACOCL|nr:V-type proton ATPase subunit C [Acorus calamus]